MPRRRSKRVDDTANCAWCRREFDRTCDTGRFCSQHCRDALRFASETADQRERRMARDREYHRQRKHGGMTDRDRQRARLDDDMRAFKVAGGKVTRVPQGATGDATVLGVALSLHESRERLKRRLSVLSAHRQRV